MTQQSGDAKHCSVKISRRQKEQIAIADLMRPESQACCAIAGTDQLLALGVEQLMPPATVLRLRLLEGSLSARRGK